MAIASQYIRGVKKFVAGSFVGLFYGESWMVNPRVTTVTRTVVADLKKKTCSVGSSVTLSVA